MSLEAISWAISVRDCSARPVTAAQKAVLLVLANRADGAGDCWPSIGTVAAEACLSERGARDAMRYLEAVALIRKIEDGGGRHKSSTYRLAIDAPETRQDLPGNKAPVQPKTRQIDANTRQELPGNEDPAEAETRQMLPETRQMLPETRQMLPETRQMLPETRQMVSERGQHLPPNPKNPKEPKGEPKERARITAPEVALPDWLPLDAWAEWCRHKGRKWGEGVGPKKALNALARYRDEGHDPRDVIDHSLASGYVGLFPSKSHKPSGSQQAGKLDWMDTDPLFSRNR